MELNYIKEHTSCVNYKTEEYSGFSLGQALTGENFDNQEQEIKANHLIFILSGEVEITKDENEKAAFVEVYKDNELYKKIPLGEEAEFTIKDGEHINKVKVHDNGVEVIEANCPDKVCVKTGFITKPSQSIVCIPNKLNIKIVDSNSDDSIDAVVQ